MPIAQVSSEAGTPTSGLSGERSIESIVLR